MRSCRDIRSRDVDGPFLGPVAALLQLGARVRDEEEMALSVDMTRGLFEHPLLITSQDQYQAHHSRGQQDGEENHDTLLLKTQLLSFG
jgi:hypothetical protein